MVTLIDPMTRGLKDKNPPTNLFNFSLVTLIDPMTRGLKDKKQGQFFQTA